MKKLKNLFIIIMLLLSLVFVSACDGSFFESGTDDSSAVTYDVEDNYFTVSGYSKSKSTTVGVNGNGSSSTTYNISIKVKCTVSLIEYSINAYFYSSDNTLLETYVSSSVKKTVSANTQFTVSAKVSESTYTSINSVTAVLNGKTYDSSSVGGILSGTWYTVTLVYNNGDADGCVSVKKGATLTTPADPVKTNYIFTGWYTTSSLSTKYDFSQSVTKDFTIYAGYEIDATSLTNTINTSSIKGLVTVYNKCYNSFLGITTSSSTYQGSGFCFAISSNSYFILTNCHVAALYSDYDKQKFTIEDYKGNEYTGYLYKSAIAASYDLACLYFKADSAPVTKFTFGSDPEVSDDVISLGTPGGQTNYINYGSVASFSKITLNTSAEYSNVTFSVIRHTAKVSGGCSGGPLLDSNLKVVGVNYAASSSVNYNYAIPVSKVTEFLNTYVY